MVREESIDPSEGEEVYEEGEEFLPQQEEVGSPPGRSAGAFLMTLGFGILAAGIGLSLAPEYSWKVTKLARQLEALGFQPGPITMGGLILFGLGIVARTRTTASPVSAGQDSDFLMVADQLATDLSRMNSSLIRVQEELAAIEEAQRMFAGKRASEEAEAAEQHNAMFRMAASLDKLGASVGQQLRGLQGNLSASASPATAGVGVPEASEPPRPVLPETQPDTGLELGLPASETFLAPVEEPSAALPFNPAPGELGDPSQEVYDAFEGLERSADEQL